jgi:thiamine kinase-like enzyme
VQPLGGGLTNRVYRVTAPDRRPVVIRRPALPRSLEPPGLPMPADRRVQCHSALAAAHAGVAPAVLLFDPSDGTCALDWIDGRTLTDADLHRPATLTRIAALCRRLHAGPRLRGDLDVFAIQRSYRDLVRQRGWWLPAGYPGFADQVEVIRQALASHPVRSVPCHNDLVAANILDDGTRLWFVDFDYAANNDPCFELGNLWSAAGLGPDHLTHLVSSYFGVASSAKEARARLLALVANYAWTLWASIQDAAGAVDFDFRAWGAATYERAVAEFRGPDLARLLAEVQRRDDSTR